MGKRVAEIDEPNYDFHLWLGTFETSYDVVAYNRVVIRSNSIFLIMCTQKPSSEFNWLKQFDTQWGSREDYGLGRGFQLPISLGVLAKNTFVGATGIFRAIFASHATFSETCRVTVDEIITSSSLIDIFPKAKYEVNAMLERQVTVSRILGYTVV
ncbi:hypothetical protein KY290_033242 [Solanum tuberosum]|uniref:Uncharacterized protein n=1 Tax=Solanum tuberosum TaxID=4113 RepID=A0ABQ7TZQ2_SOLTU|nr:hypothetical protein KY285_032499 [Solanum tuberosum]KAH0740199.1 hypothetical protein KY290_033242 [Solanum tuberosum]